LLFAFVCLLDAQSALAANMPDEYLDVETKYHEDYQVPRVDWQLISESAELIENTDGQVMMVFKLSAELTALKDSLYIPLSVRKSSDSFFGGFGYNIESTTGPFTYFDTRGAVIETEAEVINGHAFIPAGSSETFSLLVAVVPFAEQVGQQYRLKLSSAEYVHRKSDFSKAEFYTVVFIDSRTGGDTMVTAYLPFNNAGAYELRSGFDENGFYIPSTEKVLRSVAEVNYPAEKLTGHSTTVVACCGNRASLLAKVSAPPIIYYVHSSSEQAHEAFWTD
jgi:hypothetical protein